MIFRELLLKSGMLHCGLLAFEGEKAIGLAWGRIEASNPRRADLYQMWVAPHSRRSGYGQALVGRIVDWASDAGATELHLGVTCGIEAARALYESVGFRAVGPTEALREDSPLRSQPMVLELGGTGASKRVSASS